jgi:hypothetical protein
MNQSHNMFFRCLKLKSTNSRKWREILHPTVVRLRRHVRSNPWKVVVLSLMAGAVCGWVLGRRD